MDPQFETVQLEGDSSIRSLHFGCDAFQNDHTWHYHEECELSFIVKGRGTRFVGDSVEPFGPGDLVFLGPNLPHCWVSDNDHRDNEMQVLQFHLNCLGDEFFQTPEAHLVRKMIAQGARGIHFIGADRDQIVELLNSVENSSGLQRLATFLQLLDKLSRSDATTLLTSDVFETDRSQFHSARLHKVMVFVRDNLNKEIKQTDVAELVSMTPQSFSRFFKASTGRTFVSFVNLMRITEACRLLTSGEQDIMDIAYQCGYANLSNFNRRFAEIKHLTPSEYRRQHQALQ